MTAVPDLDGPWCNDHLGPLDRVRSIAVVGNGSSLGERHDGPAIDAADVVVRMNAFTLRDTTTTGTRTDVWGCNMLASRPVDELTALGVRAVIGARPASVKHAFNVALPRLRRTCVELGGLPLALVSEAEFDDLYERLGLTPGVRDGRNPSTGLVLVAALLTHVADAEVRCYGFDLFDTSAPFHYFADPVYNRVGATERVHRYHDPGREAEVLLELERAAAGRLRLHGRRFD